MKLAVMQPYFMPYIGYWQLISSVDKFIIYDNIEFTKKGWFNRNRILDGNHDRLFTIPIKKDSDYLPVYQRFLADDSDQEIARILRIIEITYKKAPYFNEVYPLIQKCFLFQDKNLFAYIYNSVQIVCAYLQITTPIILSSQIPIDHSLKSTQKVLALCQAEGATTYINAIGGKDLYANEDFSTEGIELKFIQSNPINYQQYGNSFVPWLSVIDVMMFNDGTTIKRMLTEYQLV